MKYIKAPDTYPYYEYQLKADNPDVSFPVHIPEDIMNEYGCFAVQEMPKPDGDVVEEQLPLLIEGVWTQQWSSRDYTEEELNEIRSKQKVSQRKARLALFQSGLLSNVETALDAMDEPAKTAAKIEWEHAPEIKRGNALVQGVATLLGWSEQQLDELFALAASIPD